MATKIYNVVMPKGYFISWFVTTQAANKVTVTLKDECKTYFAAAKQSTNIDPPLSTGNAMLLGANATITIDVPQSPQLFGTPHASDILTEEGIVVGKEFSLCIEDQKDKDYNDVSVSIVGWKNKG